MHAGIDGDIIVYEAGFSSDTSTFTVHALAGDFHFATKKEANVFCDKWLMDRAKIVKKIDHEPLEHQLHRVKILLKKIVDGAEADTYTVYLTGKDNFRESCAVTLPYKGNRDGTHKPHWYNEIKDYLIKQGAIVVDGMEADDALGIEQYYLRDPSENVICTVDKDLKMIPGNHYNWRKEEFFTMSREEADKFFYHQMLTGDMTDNIQGIKGIGPKKAEKILKNCKTDDEYWCEIGKQYAYAYDDPEETMMEMHNLLWILREPIQEETTDEPKRD